MTATSYKLRYTVILALALGVALALPSPASAQGGPPAEYQALAERECAPFFRLVGSRELCVAVVIRVLQDATLNPREACYEARFRPRRRPGQRQSDLRRCERVVTAARSRVYGPGPPPPPAPPPPADPIPAF
jgi:hypothetical protein